MNSKVATDTRRDSVGPAKWLEWLRGWTDVLGPMVVAAVTYAAALSTYSVLPILRDALGYTMTAQRLSQLGYLAYGTQPATVAVEPSAFVTPGYPIFLSAIYWFFRSVPGGAEEIARQAHPVVLGAQFVLALATVGLIAWSGKALGGTRLAWVAGLAAALYLPFGWASSVALSEVLGTVLAAGQLLVALLLTAEKNERPWWLLLLFGVVSGALAMVRPAFALWVAVPIVYLFVRNWGAWRNLARWSVLVAAGLAIVVVPWVARNAIVLHRFIPLSSNSGTPMFDATGGGELTAEERAVYDAATAVGADDPAALGEVAMYRMRQAWNADALGLVGMRSARAWQWVTVPWAAPIDVHWELANQPEENASAIFVDTGAARLERTFLSLLPAVRYYQYALVAFAIVGVLFVRRSRRLLVVLSVPLYTVAVHALTLFTNRYFFPAMPAVIVAAAAAGYGVYSVAVRWIRQPRMAG